MLRSGGQERQAVRASIQGRPDLHTHTVAYVCTP